MEKISEEMADNMEQSQADMLNEILLNTQEQCQIMDQVLRRQIEKKDEQIDLLHKELQYYKEAQADRLIDQAMKEVIQVRNGLLKTLRSEGWKSMDEEMLRQVIVYLEEDITDLLERQNIDPFESLPGEPFDPSKHRAAEVVPTEDEALDHRIQTSKSPGYRKNDRILVHEAVTVCRLHTEKK